ncbi:DUF4124 domain-containing protein [Imhoffiella purpurea]|uniref:DUF4124 domain-containing protein n=1 Tax=Imhoffiella purpurea TaxID=1249627 RepID=W9VI31_9GAMM|nr:DUF4124 domain-containing protein [Imhoffiella purpurea]EXJ15707.1 hypothetical protein D779_1095 [Imhoffiella purpurea]
MGASRLESAVITRHGAGGGLLAACACLMLMSPSGAALGEDRLYRWTDEAGQVHFSDRAPEASDRPVESMAMPESPGAARREGDPYSVINQTRRMEAERKARELARRRAYLDELEERQRLAEIEAAEARTRQLEAEAQRAREPVYVLPWGWLGRHHHHRPPRPRTQEYPPSPRSQMSLKRPGRSLKPVEGTVPQR